MTPKKLIMLEPDSLLGLFMSVPLLSTKIFGEIGDIRGRGEGEVLTESFDNTDFLFCSS